MSWITGLIGAIIAAIACWAMGYLQPGAEVGGGGVAVNGQVATLLMSLLGFQLPKLAPESWKDGLKRAFDRFRALKPPETETAKTATQRASEAALFFRQVLKEDQEAQVLIDELLTRSTRVCSGIANTPALTVGVDETGVNFFKKAGN